MTGSNTKRHIIDQVTLSYSRPFLAPQIDTIDQFVESVWVPAIQDQPILVGHQPYRGNRPVAADRDYYALECGRVVDGLTPHLFAKADKQLGRMVAKFCTDGKIGRFQVVKGDWPDPFALLLAHDSKYIRSPFISLIDWDHYQQWVDDAFKTLLEAA